MSKAIESPAAFRTKAGICEIGKDSIVLHRRGVRGAMASVLAKLYAILGFQCSINEIPRTAIQRIECTPAVPRLTRAYFTVYYLDDGELHKRLIILPGRWAGGAEEYEIALAVFASLGVQVSAGRSRDITMG